MSKYASFFIVIVIVFSSCTSSRRSEQTKIQHLKFLNSYVVPFGYKFQNTTVGGLSGIDYNPAKNEYYFISDDRSDKNPARFYKANILINNHKIDTVIFKKTIFFKDQNGQTYSNSKQDPYHTPDPEALRFNARNNRFTWSSEGERIVNNNKIVLENPAVTEIDSNGNFIDTFQLPSQVKMTAENFGPKQNGVFEGLTFTNSFRSLFVNVEEPLLQDGPAAATGDSSGIVRFIKFDVASKKPVAEYAYKIDPVAHKPFPAGAFKINGISDIMAINDNHLLVIERSYSTGRLACTIKVYEADLTSAQNILNIPSIQGRKGINLIKKKLLLNMDDLGIYIDNIEGVTFGPDLPGGKRSLIFIADNNFNPLERTQLLLFETE
ncbi:MAG: esterase-like activity of phytase family protein [Ginsengibacter sp.]